MINPRIALSVASIGAAAVLGVGATFAVFTDTATSTNNTFSSGNADLQLAPDNGGNPGTFAESIPGPTFNGLLPGDSKSFTFWIRNNSASNIGLDTTGDVSAINPSDDNTQTIDNSLTVKWRCDSNNNSNLTDETFTSEFSPRDWLNGGNAALGNLPFNTNRLCEMVGTLPSNADNTVANQTVVFDAQYGATQAP